MVPATTVRKQAHQYKLLGRLESCLYTLSIRHTKERRKEQLNKQKITTNQNNGLKREVGPQTNTNLSHRAVHSSLRADICTAKH